MPKGDERYIERMQCGTANPRKSGVVYRNWSLVVRT